MKASTIKFFIFCAFWAFSTVPQTFGANNIAVMVVETNITNGISNNHAAIWESGIMDVFFSEGFIVSNAQSIRIPKNKREDFPSEALIDFQEAIENGSDYFVLATLNYIPTDDKKNPPLLDSANLKLFQINPYRLVYEKKITLETGKSIAKEEWAKVQIAAKTLLPYMRNSALSMGGGGTRHSGVAAAGAGHDNE
ncbi:MAG: hypothetical protein LBG74_06765 [Spirochaetaceae bacterium]|jgi:hypothetical protein|nr:hypothetical protein [Spirochaetaceae bacterium]